MVFALLFFFRTQAFRKGERRVGEVSIRQIGRIVRWELCYAMLGTFGGLCNLRGAFATLHFAILHSSLDTIMIIYVNSCCTVFGRFSILLFIEMLRIISRFTELNVKNVHI